MKIANLLQNRFFRWVVLCLFSGLLMSQVLVNADTSITTPGLEVTNTELAEVHTLYTVDKSTSELYRFHASRNAEENADLPMLEKAAALSEFFHANSVSTVEADVTSGDEVLFIAGLSSAGGTTDEAELAKRKNVILRYEVASTNKSNVSFSRHESAEVNTVEISDLAVGPKGNIYVADKGQDQIWMINNSLERSSIQKITGSDSSLSPDASVASKLSLKDPGGIAFDRYGNLIITDTGNNRVLALKVDATTNQIDQNASVVVIAGNLALPKKSLALDDLSGSYTSASVTTSGELIKTWAGSPVKPAIDSRNNLYYFDTEDKVWIKLTDSNSGQGDKGVNSLAYTHRYEKGVQREGLSPKAGMDGAAVSNMVADWSGDQKFIMASGQEHIKSNIFAYASSAKGALGDFTTTLPKESKAMSYLRSLRPVSFNGIDPSDKFSYGDSLTYSTLEDIAEMEKRQGKFSFDFFNQAGSIAEGETHILFSIGGDADAAERYAQESLYVGLKKENAKYKLVLAQHGKDITKRYVEKKVARNNKETYNTTKTEHGYIYHEVKSFDNLPLSDFDSKWNSLDISFGPDSISINLSGKEIAVNEEVRWLFRDEFDVNTKSYYQLDKCVAEYIDWGYSGNNKWDIQEIKGYFPFPCVKAWGHTNYWQAVIDPPIDGTGGDGRSGVPKVNGQIKQLNDPENFILHFPVNFYWFEQDTKSFRAKDILGTPPTEGNINTYTYADFGRLEEYGGTEHYLLPHEESNTNDSIWRDNFKGKLRIGGYLDSSNSSLKSTQNFSSFKGMIANFNIVHKEGGRAKYYQDGKSNHARDDNNRYPSDLIGLAKGSSGITLAIKGKNSSASLHRIVGSDLYPRLFRLNTDNSTVTLKLPKYIAIDNNGDVYYSEKDSKLAEQNNALVSIIETHVLNKFYPPSNPNVPINKADIDSASTGKDHYERTITVTSSTTAFVEYVPQYRVSVSAIRPLKQDGTLSFSNTYAGLPIKFNNCPEELNSVDNFNSTSPVEIETFLGSDAAGNSVISSVLGLDSSDAVVSYDDLKRGISYCRSRVWIEANKKFEPEVQGIIYNPTDNAGKRFRLVRLHATGSLASLSRNYQLGDNYNNLESTARKLEGPTEITYVWLEQYRLNISTTKSKAAKLARIRVGGTDGKILTDHDGNGEFWIDKGTDVDLLMPVSSPELALEGFTLSEQGIGDKTVNFSNNACSGGAATGNVSDVCQTVKVDDVDYYAIKIGKSTQGLANAADVLWDFGNKVYQYQITLGQEFIPDTTATTNGVKIPAKAISAIQGLNHDPAFLIPLSKDSYVDQTTGKTTAAPATPALTAKQNAYVWQNRTGNEGFKGAMYFTRPGVYRLEWLLGGDDYPIEGAEGFQKLMAEVVVKWPTKESIKHVAGTPDVNLEVSETDGLKFKELRYSETDNLTVAGTNLSFPKWFGDTDKQYRSVLVFTQSIDDKRATGDVDKEQVVISVISSSHWSKHKELSNTFVGEEIVSSHHGNDIGHNGYLLPLLGPDGKDQAVYNPNTYTRDGMKGELFAVNTQIIEVDKSSGTEKEVTSHTDGIDDIAVVWYKRFQAAPSNSKIDSKWPAWPHVTVMYSQSWRDATEVDRIVIASRMGSDGKKNAASKTPQLKFDPAKYSDVTLYSQPDRTKAGYNPNEEHAFVAKSRRYRTETSVPDAVFALRKDLNRTNVKRINNAEDPYTSAPYVLVQYKDKTTGKYGMNVYAVVNSDPNTTDTDDGDNNSVFKYTFDYKMLAGQTVVAPYPLNTVIGASTVHEIRGESENHAYWEDRNGVPWAVSGDPGTELKSYFWYPMKANFWHPTAKVGDVVPFGDAGDYKSDGEGNKGFTKEHVVTYTPVWPTNVAELRIGETLTFSGGEHKRDNRTNTSLQGLPGALGWGSAEVIYDSLNPKHDVSKATQLYSARITPILRELSVSLSVDKFPVEMKPASKRTTVKDGNWYFDELHAGLKQRVYYDPKTGKLVLRGFVNNKTAGDETLQAAPPVDYIAQLNILTQSDLDTLLALSGSNEGEGRPLHQAFRGLHALSRNPTLTNKQLGEITSVDDQSYDGYLIGLTNLLRDRENRLMLAKTIPLSDAEVAQLPNGVMPNGLVNKTSDLEVISTDVLSNLVDLPVGMTVEDLKTINGLKEQGLKLVRIKKANSFISASQLGSGLGVTVNPNLLKPEIAKDFNGGHIVIAENNDPSKTGNPVSLHIIKVNDKPYRGMIKTVLSDDVFDEKIALSHTGDFGANVEDLVFDWRYVESSILDSDLKLSKGYKIPTADKDPSCPIEQTAMPAVADKWSAFLDDRPGNRKGLGWSQLTFGSKTGKDVLVDNSFFVRYTHKNNCALDTAGKVTALDSCKNWSGWAGAADNYPCASTPEYKPQLVMGWVKRVTENVNQYDTRINNFSTDGIPATYVSMVQQAGQMFEGDVALNGDKDVIENTGLIELYQTVLNRAKKLSIDADQTSIGVTQALQTAASRITQFYTLLGNEAYSDALDPTIGFSIDSAEYGTLAPTIHTFQNQLSSLGEEELALLRGRAEKGAKPAYNRLLWNFTNGDGEAAYALSYNISDVDKSGKIDAADARIMYPQGHGDSWGHYLSGLKTYYELLRHKQFTWESRAEAYQIEGVTLAVDYLDERRFAEAAGYKAKVGAEVLTQTYRERYVEDPDGQWQGYKDTDASQAWGVDGWARRAHQGAYYDWVTAAALIPAKSKKVGIQKIDRTTVSELQDISSEGIRVLSELAQIDNGLNPLGLLPDVVPFDIAPGTGKTQFEQVLERAESSISNALNVFDYANDLKHRVRKVADSQEEFKEQAEKQDREYRNRLIELFGTPYVGTIGAGKAYPEGYDGPDTMFYQYVDVGEVSDKTMIPPSKELTGYMKVKSFAEFSYKEPDELDLAEEGKKVLVDGVFNEGGFSESLSGGIDALTGEAKKMMVEKYVNKYFPTDFKPSLKPTPLKIDSYDVDEKDFTSEQVKYPIAEGKYSLTAPDHWGERTTPGEIQSSLLELVKADVDFKITYNDYSSVLAELKKADQESKIKKDVSKRTDKINAAADGLEAKLDAAITVAQFAQNGVENTKEALNGVTDAVKEAFPKVIGFSNDATSAIRSVSLTTKNVISAAGTVAKTGFKVAEVLAEQSKELVPIAKDAAISNVEKIAEYERHILVVNDIIARESAKRLNLFKSREIVRQAAERYRAVLGKGLRLLDERQSFNKKIAAKTHGKRYQDMAFRINRTEASQKYRAAFDMAAKYVYLSAKAYDYETNLSEKHSASALPMLSEIVRARSLGQFFNGQAVVGLGGLADTLARLKANYSVLKTQMGMNNPQMETEPFSLRRELFRIKDDNDSGWQTELKKHTVEDLWTEVPEFRTHMRPFASEMDSEQKRVKQPALVIPFSTNIISGQNFFGRPLSGGDHAYDASQFSTRIQSVGIWMSGYKGLGLAETPRAYLVPVGQDIMYVPDSYDLDTREWNVKDQKIPVPLPTGQSDLESGDWMPLKALDGPNGLIRRHSRMRVHHDSGELDASQMNDDTRLFGRSVWNSKWLLVIPGESLLNDATLGLKTLTMGKQVSVEVNGEKMIRYDRNAIDDIKLTFKTYAYSGN